MIALPWLVIPLAPLIVWVTLFGLRQSWATILNAIRWYLRQTAHSFLRYFNLVGLIADAFSDKAQPNVHQGEKSLGSEALQAEPTTAGFVAGLAGLAGFYAFTVKYLARDTLAALEGLVGHTIPAHVKTGTRTARQHAEAANQRARDAARVAVVAALGAWAALRLFGHASGHAQVTANKALAKTQAIAIPVPADIARERAQNQSTASEKAYTRWLRRIALALGVGTLSGLVVKALVRELPWFKCSNVNKTMRQLCRTPHNFLNDLLALGADFFVLSNICAVLPWLEAAFEDVAVPLIAKLTEVASRLCAPPEGAPSDTPAPRLYQPPVTFTQLYLP